MEEALKLVERTTRLVSPYLYDKDYQPTETEKGLLKQLHDACKQAYAFTGHVADTAGKPKG